MIYLIRGELPWQGMKAKTMKEKYEKIMEKKISTPIDLLCKGCPEEFQVFLHFTRDLRFDDRPDYSFLKRLLKGVCDREGYDFDNNFDWNLKIQDKEIENDAEKLKTFEYLRDNNKEETTQPKEETTKIIQSTNSTSLNQSNVNSSSINNKVIKNTKIAKK